MDPRIKLLSLWQPEDAIPTKIRRTRRVSLNIESNGSRRCRCQRPLIEPYNPANSMYYNSRFYDNYMDTGTLNYDPNCFRPRQQAGCNFTQQEAINELKYVLATLENQQQTDNKFFSSYYSPPSGSKEDALLTQESENPCKGLPMKEKLLDNKNLPQPSGLDAQLFNLTELVRQTMFKLDKFIDIQTKQKHQKSAPAKDQFSERMRTFKDNSGVKILPVVIMPQTERNKCSLAPRKKRSAAGNTNEKLYSYNSIHSSASHKQCTRDCGTTMWCPHNCCGTITESMTCVHNKGSQAEETEARSKSNASVQISPDAGKIQQTEIPSIGQPSLKDIVDVICSRLEVEKKRSDAGSYLGAQAAVAETSSIDDWFKNAENSLAMLETQEKYYSKNKTKEKPCTSHKLLETESKSSKDISDNQLRTCRCVPTSDKSVSNSDLQEKTPVQIVNIYKNSNLKSRNAKRKATKQKEKVHFEEDFKKQLKVNFIKATETPKSTKPTFKCRVLKSMSEALHNENINHAVCSLRKPNYQQLLDDLNKNS